MALLVEPEKDGQECPSYAVVLPSSSSPANFAVRFHRAKISRNALASGSLSRACEQRADKRPIPSDLRESGSIEQDADKILMRYRESEYNEDCEDPHLTEVWIRKNRHGPKGCVELHFAHEKMSFADRNDSASM